MADFRLKKKLKKKQSLDVPNSLDPTGTVGRIKKRKVATEAYANEPTPAPKGKLKEKLISPDSTVTGSLPADWLERHTKYPEPKKKKKLPVKKR